MPVYRVRIELWCGSGKSGTMDKAHERYRKARKIAGEFGAQTYFEDSVQDGIMYADGYIYPRSDNVEGVLDAMDKAGVEYDYIDLPEELTGSELQKRLEEREDVPGGATVTTDYETRVCRPRNPTCRSGCPPTHVRQYKKVR